MLKRNCCSVYTNIYFSSNFLSFIFITLTKDSPEQLKERRIHLAHCFSELLWDSVMVRAVSIMIGQGEERGESWAQHSTGCFLPGFCLPASDCTAAGTFRVTLFSAIDPFQKPLTHTCGCALSMCDFKSNEVGNEDQSLQYLWWFETKRPSKRVAFLGSMA